MVDFYIALYAIFNVAVANWTNLGKKPEIMEEGQNRSASPNLGMQIEDLEPGECRNDHQGTVLYEKQRGRVFGWAESKADRENFILDVKALYKASSDDGEIVSIARLPYIDRWELECVIERLT